MIIFGKDVNIRNYDCSKDNINYPICDIPNIAMYVQAINSCNARCSFCDFGDVCDTFDFGKYTQVLDELNLKVHLTKIAITGGEPLLNIERTIKIAEISKKYTSQVCLNTNGFSCKKLKAVYPYVQQIDISRHHYNEEIHQSILKTNLATIKELTNEVDYKRKITINCVLQKGLIDSFEEVINFLEEMAIYGISFVKFISLLPLTKEAKEGYVDPIPIINKCKNFTNGGMVYDKDMCNCFEFIYLAKCGKVVRVIIRNTINSCYSCIKQLVFNGNYLYDGFKKQNIIC